MPKVEKITARDVYEAACALASQDPGDSPELEQFAPSWLDTLVYEALAFENMRRKYEGDLSRPPLPDAPRIESLDDEIPYDDEICRIALPYGLASQIFKDDQEEYQAQDFRGRFINALAETMKTAGESVVDVYA